MTQDKKIAIGYEEAAQILGMPIGTLYSFVCTKRIPHYRLSKRIVRFYYDELMNWLEQRKVKENPQDIKQTFLSKKGNR